MNFTYENTCYFESVYNDTRKDIRIEKAAILSKRAQTVFQAASAWSYFSRQCFFYELTGGSSRWWYRLSSPASWHLQTPRTRVHEPLEFQRMFS